MEEPRAGGALGFGLSWFAVTFLAFGGSIGLAQAASLFLGLWSVEVLAGAMAVVATVGCQCWLLSRRRAPWLRWLLAGSVGVTTMVALLFAQGVATTMDHHVAVGAAVGTLAGALGGLALVGRTSVALVGAATGTWLGGHLALAMEPFPGFSSPYLVILATGGVLMAEAQSTAVKGMGRRAVWLAAAAGPLVLLGLEESWVQDEIFFRLLAALTSPMQSSIVGYLLPLHGYLVLPGLVLAATTAVVAPVVFPQTTEPSP